MNLTHARPHHDYLVRSLLADPSPTSVHDVPDWDTYDRQAHPTPVRSHGAASAARVHLPPNRGTRSAWYACHPDELLIDSATCNIPPWHAYNPKYNRITINFAVALDMSFMDPEWFFSGFGTTGFRRDLQKHFEQSFPAYTVARTFFVYHEDVVRHCQQYGIFVPPLHTLRSGLPLGTWFEHSRIPTWLVPEVQTASPLISRCLGGKHGGLRDASTFASIVATDSGNGYQTLYDLATAAGHPLLSTYVVTPPEPQQKPDQTIPEYITQWNSFIKLRLLDGCAYNDRYYIDRILAGMQPALRIHFEPALSHLCMSSPLDEALPSQLHPMSIVGTLTQRAKELGHPEYMALTTRSLHAVFGQRQCYICLSTTHTMRECPTRKRLEEPAIRRQLGLPPIPAVVNQVDIPETIVAPDDAITPLVDPDGPDFH
jgi:hypothetical protein